MKTIIKMIVTIMLLGAMLMSVTACTQSLAADNPDLDKELNEWITPVDVPADAVLPPVRHGSSAPNPVLTTKFGFKSAFEDAEAVCLITVENWLSDSMFCTFFEASVDKVYKGDLPDTIVLRQEESSSANHGAPVFTYGNKLLVFLKTWDRWEDVSYENAYYIIGGCCYMFPAQDHEGKLYLIDLFGEFSYMNRKLKEASASDCYSTWLIAELIEYLDKQDSELAKTVELFTHDTARNEPVPEGADRMITVYEFADVERYLNEWGE